MREDTVVVVAIAGGSGSGKSWLARELAARAGVEAGVVSLDRFYRDLRERTLARRERVNFDSPRALDWEAFEGCLGRILRGENPEIPDYDFRNHTRRPITTAWQVKPLVLVEGLWPWVRRRMARCYALRIFRDVPAEVRLARRLERDVRERGRTEESVRRQWEGQSEPMYERHVLPQRDDADLILGTEVTLNDWRRIAGAMGARAGIRMRE